jgi:hypothetical protein
MKIAMGLVLLLLVTIYIPIALPTKANADSLSLTDRYNSGYNHGYADAQARNSRFCSQDHTIAYCQGYNAGYAAYTSANSWTLIVYINNARSSVQNVYVDIYAEHAKNPNYHRYATAGMQNGNGWAKWTINNSDIGPGDTYRVCENKAPPGQAVLTPLCHDFTHSKISVVSYTIDLAGS